MPPTEPILAVRDLRTHFHTPDGLARAVDGVDYAVRPGETLGIVGESGCGKSVSALSILRLIPCPPGEIASGQVLLDGEDLLRLPPRRMRRIRGNRISMIFQEPMTSLNPVFSVGYQLCTVIRRHQRSTRRHARRAAGEMLAACDIASPERILGTYPHELSGGMRQRVMIAMALACRPAVLIADEPTTALDVTIQAQILELMAGLQRQMGMALILITHDLGIVAGLAQRVVVMYAGRKVEEADAATLFARPAHPYTRALLHSLPVLGRKTAFLPEIAGVVPAPHETMTGCTFAPRCPEALEACRAARPALTPITDGHLVACIRR